MEFIVNDLSLDGQFPDIVSFRSAIRKLMEIRKITCRFGRTLYCHRGLSRAQVTQTMRMPQVVQALGVDERRVLMQWLTRNGPFWDDMRNHQPEDWLEWNDEIVTDTAIGEAAWCCLNGIERSLVSFSPSDWQFSPVPVNWMNETGIKKDADVLNYWDPDEIETALQNAPVPLNSWEQLSRIAIARCHQLFFAEDAFVALDGYPFVSSAAQQVVVLLDILNRFTTCFDNDGQRTQEGHEIYKDFFTGKKGDGGRGAPFSDSSAGEKNKFESKMTFKHPVDAKKSLLCPWHGKVQTPQLRVHFSWPIRVDEPLYVVYVGPKLTMN